MSKPLMLALSKFWYMLWVFIPLAFSSSVAPISYFSIMSFTSLMYPLAEKAVAREDYKDVAYFEPFYLKEFVASLPKKSLLE